MFESVIHGVITMRFDLMRFVWIVACCCFLVLIFFFSFVLLLFFRENGDIQSNSNRLINKCGFDIPPTNNYKNRNKFKWHESTMVTHMVQAIFEIWCYSPPPQTFGQLKLQQHIHIAINHHWNKQINWILSLLYLLGVFVTIFKIYRNEKSHYKHTRHNHTETRTFSLTHLEIGECWKRFLFPQKNNSKTKKKDPFNRYFGCIRQKKLTFHA